MHNSQFFSIQATGRNNDLCFTLGVLSTATFQIVIGERNENNKYIMAYTQD